MDNILTNSDFISRHKRQIQDFTRKRSLTFKSLALFIISSIQSSIQRDLDRFFKNYFNKQVSERFISQSAFSQARVKINPSAFKELYKASVAHFYKNYEVKRWKGFRLIAIDGSEVMLPKTTETIERFGSYTSNFMNKTIVLARISKLYDVINKITIDAELVNRNIGEHTLAKQHLEFCGQDDLILLDRGYPSFDLFMNILASESHFCARLPVSNWNKAKELVESGQNEIITEINPGNELKGRYKKEGVAVAPIKCRFICITLPSGEKEVLITSLLDKERFPHNIFKRLYHLRWGIEESYKCDKHRLQLENFSGKTITAIYQDLFAKILLANLTSMLTNGLEKEINKHRKNNKHKYQINITTAIAKVREAVALLFSSIDLHCILNKLKLVFLGNVLPIRPNRSFVRNKNQRKRYHKSYPAL